MFNAVKFGGRGNFYAIETNSLRQGASMTAQSICRTTFSAPAAGIRG